MGEALEEATARLARAGVPRPRREARLLAALVLGTDLGGTVARRPDPVPDRFEELLRRREAREPLQYLAGEAEFLGRAFRVDRRVLVPRPETEQLAETVLAAGLPERARVADLGTGSGCLAISFALERPSWTVLALERSVDALALARANAAGLGAALTFLPGDLADPPPALAALDAVVSNPPYVSEEEWAGLAPEVRDHEPREALVPGPTGLEAYAALLPALRPRLVPGGLLALELGWKSAEPVRALAREAGFTEIRLDPDPRGIPRVLTGRA